MRRQRNANSTAFPAEFIELMNGSARRIITKTLLAEMEKTVQPQKEWRPAGDGKVRHLAVRLLWLLDAVRERVLSVVNMKGETRREDIMTKPLERARRATLMTLLYRYRKPPSRGGTAGSWAG